MCVGGDCSSHLQERLVREEEVDLRPLCSPPVLNTDPLRMCGGAGGGREQFFWGSEFLHSLVVPL